MSSPLGPEHGEKASTSALEQQCDEMFKAMLEQQREIETLKGQLEDAHRLTADDTEETNSLYRRLDEQRDEIGALKRSLAEAKANVGYVEGHDAAYWHAENKKARVALRIHYRNQRCGGKGGSGNGNGGTRGMGPPPTPVRSANGGLSGPPSLALYPSRAGSSASSSCRSTPQYA